MYIALHIKICSKVEAKLCNYMHICNYKKVWFACTVHILYEGFATNKIGREVREKLIVRRSLYVKIGEQTSWLFFCRSLFAKSNFRWFKHF